MRYRVLSDQVFSICTKKAVSSPAGTQLVCVLLSLARLAVLVGWAKLVISSSSSSLHAWVHKSVGVGSGMTFME